MMEVILHIYDVTNSGSDKTNNTIVQINKIFKDGIGLGGIFHSAVQVAHAFHSYFKFLFIRMWHLRYSDDFGTLSCNLVSREDLGYLLLSIVFCWNSLKLMNLCTVVE